MKLIKFEDSCKVLRPNGEYDTWGNLASDVVYEGACNYQKGGQTSLSIVTRNDVVYLPSNDVEVKENDIVEGFSVKYREFKGVVKVARDIRMPLSRKEYTRIELTKATGT
jgi:hypothetical protein